MLQHKLRAPVGILINPLCRTLVKVGIRANQLTVIGALGVSISSLYFFPAGRFLLGTIVVSLFALLDLLDGTVARMSDSTPSRWGALLDSTVDRISDAMIVVGIAVYLDRETTTTILLPLSVMVVSGLVPYIRARAEALGIACSVGIGERTERLIILLVGTFLFSIGVSGGLVVGLWLVLIISTITVAQRLAVVLRS